MRIAITGGIADGKTTVCEMIRALGFNVVSADAVVDDLYRDPDVLRMIAELAEAFGVSGTDRQGLRSVVTEQPEARHRLNAILHPPVMRRIVDETSGDDIHFAEVPLLIETATQSLFDEVWVVVAGAAEQRRRLAERLGSVEEADAMLATQLPTDVKIPFAERVIRTNEPVETVKSKITALVEEAERRASRT
jgi:dephospho-CoA kinase